MTDENKDVKSIAPGTSKQPGEKKPEKQTKTPKGPNMLDFGKELPPGLIEAELKKLLLQDIFGKAENLIDQKFSIRMPYSDTCKAYLQTKSGFLCMNNSEEIELGHKFLQVIDEEITKELLSKKSPPSTANEKKVEDLPGAFGIDQSNPANTY